MTVLGSDSKTVGDAVKFVMHPAYNYEGRPLKNTTGSDLSLVRLGAQPVKIVGNNFEFIVAGDEANTDGLLVDVDPVDLLNGATTTLKRKALVRGPAIVKQEGIPDDDVEGAALDLDAIATALVALDPPIVIVHHPVVLGPQTT